MNGTLYGIGVGPGDPELLTLKACRLIRENNIIAVPAKEPRQSVAYRIALEAVPELAQKRLIGLDFPMSKDPSILSHSHQKLAKRLEEFLIQGESVIFLTLGDVSLYSTFGYVERLVRADGFQTQWVSGIPSFCAMAAHLSFPLVEGSEPLLIFPDFRSYLSYCQAQDNSNKDLPIAGCMAINQTDDGTTNSSGFSPTIKSLQKAESTEKDISHETVVLMKISQHWPQVRQWWLTTLDQVVLVENGGLPNQRIYYRGDALPESADYLSLIIVKRTHQSADQYLH